MFKVYLTNFGYFKEQSFATLERAVEFGKTLGFDFTVYSTDLDEDTNLVYIYSVISGGRKVAG